MVYNFRLFWRTTYRSFFAADNTPARLTRKHISSAVLFSLAARVADALVLFLSGRHPFSRTQNTSD
jgi:hypothetical protein